MGFVDALEPFLRTVHVYQADMVFALTLKQSGTLAALLAEGAELAGAYS
ncbi:hypothetical protein [Deinococcus sp. KSM4-11]|nr:hypothetical protein [Deinococcus sp. KSM4-11]